MPNGNSVYAKRANNKHAKVIVEKQIPLELRAAVLASGHPCSSAYQKVNRIKQINGIQSQYHSGVNVSTVYNK